MLVGRAQADPRVTVAPTVIPINWRFQIEARINQNTEISQQLTLWNQMGSRVIRGANLLVIMRGLLEDMSRQSGGH
jgi:uncharacterized membrane protein (UPF0182 family)